MNRDTFGAGLCAECRHVRRIRSGRGSTFLLCGLAATDPRFRRYPPLPVLHCPGYQSGPPSDPAAEA
ncbi:MAG: hypothetical protein ABI629_05675 [bacterium]